MNLSNAKKTTRNKAAKTDHLKTSNLPVETITFRAPEERR